MIQAISRQKRKETHGKALDLDADVLQDHELLALYKKRTFKILMKRNGSTWLSLGSALDFEEMT